MAKNCNKGKQYRGKKGFKPNRSKTDMKEEIMDGSVQENVHPNDLSWYVIDEQVLNDAARIPYSIPVGMPFKREGTVTFNSNVQGSSYDDAIPGIFVSNLMPVLGPAQSAGDPVNVAANNVYQYVRSRISGSRPYNAVDIMIYLGAMDSLYCVITWLSRLYATVFTYHQANRYLSRALIESQGVDYDNLVANLSSFRQRINVLIAKVRGLYLPSILPIFKRHSWLFSHYYIEGPSEKDQIYMHVPAGIHHFEYDSDGAGMLRARRLDKTVDMTVDQLINVLNYLIDPIYADEDFNRISGDLLKAYEGNVFTLSEVPDIATTEFIFNEEVLLQFKNAKYASVPADGDVFYSGFFSYTQDTTKTYLQMTMPFRNFEYCREIDTGVNSLYDGTISADMIADLSAKQYEWSKPTLLTSPHSDVTPGENMINTRLTLGVHFKETGSDWHSEADGFTFGTEWPLNFEIFTYHRSKGTNITTLFRRIYEHSMYVSIETPGAVQQWIDSQVPVLSSFKYIPELLINYKSGNVGGGGKVYIAGRPMFEVDNYALVDYNVLEGLHSAAILGEFNIPKLAVGK